MFTFKQFLDTFHKHYKTVKLLIIHFDQYKPFLSLLTPKLISDCCLVFI